MEASEILAQRSTMDALLAWTKESLKSENATGQQIRLAKFTKEGKVFQTLETYAPRTLSLWEKFKKAIGIFEYNTKKIQDTAIKILDLYAKNPNSFTDYNQEIPILGSAIVAKINRLNPAKRMSESLEKYFKSLSEKKQASSSDLTPSPTPTSDSSSQPAPKPPGRTEARVAAVLQGEVQLLRPPKHLAETANLQQGRAPLDNPAVYCYRNASLSALWASSAFRKLLNRLTKKRGENQIADLLSGVLSKLDGTDRVYHSEGDLALLNQHIDASFKELADALQQQDSSSFFRALMNCIDPKNQEFYWVPERKKHGAGSSVSPDPDFAKYVSGSSPLVQEWQEYPRVVPKECPRGSLQEHMHGFVHEIESKGTFTETPHIFGPPPQFLPIEISRYTEQTQPDGSKIFLKDMTRVTIPEELSISSQPGNKQIRYRLKSVVVHEGDRLGGGHYEAVIVDPEKKGSMYIAGDGSSFTKTSIEDTRESIEQNATILLYEKVE